jgi:RNA polymerase sigma factor (sigma-70 family)
MEPRSLLDLVHAIGRSEQLQADLVQPDAVLLERFVRARDEGAFEAILHRHGPLVYTVCRRLLSNPDDTADAFQATFLVLARKAGAIATGSLLANWLYGVAYRVGTRARKNRLRRGAREQADADLTRFPASDEPGDGALTRELCEEVERLPPSYREPIVLCYLEGKTVEQAATELRCPATTVKGRLALARERLRQRLVRRGVPLTAELVAGHALAGPAPAALIVQTLQAAPAFADGALVGTVSAQVIALTTGVLRTMLLSKLKTVVPVLVAITLLTGTGVTAYRTNAWDKPADEKKADRPKADKPKADKEAILGTWQVVSVEFSGQKNPEGADFDLLRKAKLTFTKDKQITEMAGGKREHDYTLDSTRTPKALDIQDGDPRTRAIYALEGDRLTICFPNAGAAVRNRPSKLATQEGDGLFLLVLKREGKEKPAEK